MARSVPGRGMAGRFKGRPGRRPRPRPARGARLAPGDATRAGCFAARGAERARVASGGRARREETPAPGRGQGGRARGGSRGVGRSCQRSGKAAGGTPRDSRPLTPGDQPLSDPCAQGAAAARPRPGQRRGAGVDGADRTVPEAGGMRGQPRLGSLPHAPGLGFIRERELLRLKTKQLILNWVKRQLLTSTGLRREAYRQNRAIKIHTNARKWCCIQPAE